MNNDRKDDHISIPIEKAYILQKIEVLHEVENDLLIWAKKRFWVISIVSVLIAFFGGSALITNMVKSQVDKRVKEEITKYENKLSKLSDATAVSNATTKRALNAAILAEEELIKFEEKTKTMGTKLASLSISIESEASSLKARTEVSENSLIKRIMTVEELILKSTDVKNADEYISAKKTLETETAKEKELFNKYSTYRVTINYDSKHELTAQSINDRLAKIGYISKAKHWEYENYIKAEEKEPYYSRLPEYAEIASWKNEEVITNIISTTKDIVSLSYNSKNRIRFLPQITKLLEVLKYDETISIFLMEKK